MYLRPTEEYTAGVIGLLDVGMVARLDDRLREKIDRAFIAVVRRDAATLTELIVQVGDVPPHFDPEDLQAEVADQLAFYYGMPMEQFQLGTVLNELTEAIRRYHVMLPSALAMLLRVLVILEGTGRLLAPGFNLIELLESYQRKLVLKKLSPRRLWRRVATASKDWEELLAVCRVSSAASSASCTGRNSVCN